MDISCPARHHALDRQAWLRATRLEAEPPVRWTPTAGPSMAAYVEIPMVAVKVVDRAPGRIIPDVPSTAPSAREAGV
jgi:hypothetical protein